MEGGEIIVDHYAKTNEMIAMPPGSQWQDDNGDTWVRMEDKPGFHLEGCYFNVRTGRFIHVSHLVYPDK